MGEVCGVRSTGKVQGGEVQWARSRGEVHGGEVQSGGVQWVRPSGWAGWVEDLRRERCQSCASKKGSGAWFRSTDLWVMSPTR